MPCKNFQLEVLNYTCGLVDYGGAKYLNLSAVYGSIPMGIIYHKAKGVVYIALLPYGSNPSYIFGIAEINILSKSLKVYRFPWKIDENYYGPMPWTIAIDKDGNLWISIRSYCITPDHPPDLIPYLTKLETEAANLTVFYIPTGAGSDIKYYNGSVWYMTNYGLSRISLDGVIEEFYQRDFSGGFMEPDGNSIWISSVVNGFVTRFNLTSKTFDVNITGLDRPLGIESDKDYIYVAENSRSAGYGTIAVISKKDFTIQRKQTAQITNEGPYHVLKDSYGNLWWTDNSKHFGVFDVTGKLTVYDAISPFCYFMTETPGTIWFSCKGSSYVGLIPIFQSAGSASGGGGSKICIK